MSTPHRVAVLLATALLLTACSGTGPRTPESDSKITSPANPQFERVKELVGDWYLIDAEPEDGPTATYRLSANETAVVERLFPGERKEMVTMYFVDDGRLTLTHFCALGNQPTMGALSGADPEDEIEFEFLGITDLESPTGMHMHEHVFEFTEDDNRMTSVWVLWNGGAEAERRRFPLERRAVPLQ